MLPLGKPLRSLPLRRGDTGKSTRDDSLMAATWEADGMVWRHWNNHLLGIAVVNFFIELVAVQPRCDIVNSSTMK